MRRSDGHAVILVASAWLAAGDARQDVVVPPPEKYRALVVERQELPEELASVRTDEERNRVRARLASLPTRFLALADEHPDDPIALDALIQTVSLVNATAFPESGAESPGDRALSRLLRGHVDSEKLGPVCQQILFGFHRGHETFLRSVLARSPHREVQALACLSLAQHLDNRLQRLDVLKDQDGTELVERYHRVFGRDCVEELQQQDRAAIATEAEALFVRAAQEYGDVPIPVTCFGSGGTVGAKAGAELFQIRHLSIGKEAPEIEGEDQEGRRFKLSDYRGKVVLLDFWNHL